MITAIRFWSLPFFLLLLPSLAFGEQLLQESFDGEFAHADWSVTWDDSHYTPTTAYSKFSTSSPAEGTHSLVYPVLENTDEKTPIKGELSFELIDSIPNSVTEIYVEWSEKVGTGFCWAQGHKLLRLGYYDEGNTAGQLETTVIQEGTNTNLQAQVFCGLWGDSSNCNYDNAANSSTGFTDNTWYRLGLHVKLNTPSTADGFVRLYRRETTDAGVMELADEIAALEDQNIRGSNTNGYNYMWIGGNYSKGSGSMPSCDGLRYVDDFRVYETFSDAASSSSSSSSSSSGGGGYLAGYHY